MKAGGKAPTGKIVLDIVQQVMERTQVSNFSYVRNPGVWEVWEEIFPPSPHTPPSSIPAHSPHSPLTREKFGKYPIPTIWVRCAKSLLLTTPTLRAKAGAGALSAKLISSAASVKMWDGEYTVALKHLKSYEYLPAECQQMQAICDRISRVYSTELEELVLRFLESLAKLKRAYLTDLEEKVLRVLELEIEG